VNLRAPEDAAPLALELRAGVETLGLQLPQGAEATLLAYLGLIARWNKVYNLTAIRQPEEMLRQHLLDSLAALPPLAKEAALLPDSMAALPQPVSVLDVGSGAGLPGVVLAIARPDWRVCCIDTVAKKATFIRQVAAELGLPRLESLHQRVEALSGRRFSLITSRAFASLADFVALTRHLLAPGGAWVAMKAHLSEAERNELPAGVVIERVEPRHVPGLSAERCLVWLRPLPERESEGAAPGQAGLRAGQARPTVLGAAAGAQPAFNPSRAISACSRATVSRRKAA
jgi:16S rRNA (guanine527-N7)-methyltransferase